MVRPGSRHAVCPDRCEFSNFPTVTGLPALGNALKRLLVEWAIVGIVARTLLLIFKEVVAFVSTWWKALRRVLWRLASVAVLVILVVVGYQG